MNSSDGTGVRAKSGERETWDRHWASIRPGSSLFGRIASLVRTRLLSGAAGRSRQLAGVLVELATLRPDDDEIFANALRLAERISDFEAIAKLCRQRLTRGAALPRVRLALVAALRRAGNVREPTFRTPSMEFKR